MLNAREGWKDEQRGIALSPLRTSVVSVIVNTGKSRISNKQPCMQAAHSMHKSDRHLCLSERPLWAHVYELAKLGQPNDTLLRLPATLLGLSEWRQCRRLLEPCRKGCTLCT